MRKELLLVLVPALLALTACTQEVTLKGSEEDLARRSLTEAANLVIYPDDNPSVPDGKYLWDKNNCASCHGASGKGSVTVDLSNPLFMRQRKPVEQYQLLVYGGDGKHPALKDKMSRRQIWDLVFYSRSLAVPALTDDEFAQLDPVFGANCAVCHGKRGHGDGPLTKPVPGQAILPLEPLPANFHQFERFYDRTDAQLFDHIANGIEWTGMPNFLGKKDKAKNVTFDEAYIRNLVRYVRNFHSSNQPTLPEATAKQQQEG